MGDAGTCCGVGEGVTSARTNVRHAAENKVQRLVGRSHEELEAEVDA